MKLKYGLIAAFCCLYTVGVQGAQARNYLDNIGVFWRNVYPSGGATLYCGTAFKPFDRSVNLEHVFPMDWVTNELLCGERTECRQGSERFNRIESDMHNLYPSLRQINEARGSYPFGDLWGEERNFGDCDFEVSSSKRIAEPRPDARGEIARAMLYMADTYDLPLFGRQLKMLKTWNLEDPPSDEERRRNDVIEKLQGQRNGFIDDPAAAGSL